MQRPTTRRKVAGGAFISSSNGRRNPPKNPQLISDVNELKRWLERNLSVLNDSSLFASSSKQPQEVDPLARQLIETNEKIKDRIAELESQEVDALVVGLGETRLTPNENAHGIDMSRLSLNEHPNQPTSTNETLYQPEMSPTRSIALNSGGATHRASGKRNLEKVIEDRIAQQSQSIPDGNIIQKDRRKSVLQIPVSQSLQLQEAEARLHGLKQMIRSWAPGHQHRSALNGGMDQDGAFDELDEISRAARLKSFMTFGTGGVYDDDWGGFTPEEYADDDAEDEFLEAEYDEERGGIDDDGGMESDAEPMELSGIIQVDVARTEAARTESLES